MYNKLFVSLALAAALAVPMHAQESVATSDASSSTRDQAQQGAATPQNSQPTTPQTSGPVQDSTQPAQDNSQSQQNSSAQQNNTAVEPMNQTPVYRVDVIQRTTKAVDYRDRGGSTEVDFRGTSLMPEVNGTAKVTGHTGRLAIDSSLHHLQPARTFGPQYLTYVLWAVTPEGRPANLGEVIPNADGNADLQLTTALQSFGLIVTAEPYFAVTRPSDIVVAENYVPNNVKGFVRTIDAKFDLLQRGQYTVNIKPEQLPATGENYKKVPLQLLEARNAVAIARAAGADQYAADTLAKAQADLDRANQYDIQNQGKTAIGTAARAATQAAEDARLIAMDKKEQARAAAAREAMQQKVSNAQSEAEASAERAQLARLQAQQEAEQRARAEAEREAAQRAAENAEQARLAAAQQAQQAQQQLSQAEAARQQYAQQAQQVQEQRARLLAQLNSVLQTRDTARGLVSQMPDVLFDLNKATLKPDAKVRLAKVAGIIVAYPDLRLEIDGHTDSTGTLHHNEVLSEQRAAAVRDFLISQGVPADSVNAKGFGPNNPVASNATASGRQQNRRVELVVSGTAIGQNIGAPATNTGASGTGGVSGTAASGINNANPAPAASGNVGASVGNSSTAGATGTLPPANTTTPAAGGSGASAGTATPGVQPSTAGNADVSGTVGTPAGTVPATGTPPPPPPNQNMQPPPPQQ
jgi:outer membrane protein OmpA-like peptidoglycan-associated protein